MLRLFVAISFSPEFINAVKKETDDLAGQFPGIKWVKKENLHLTLKFLGSVPVVRVGEIGRRLESVAVKHKEFFLESGTLGYFERDELIILMKINPTQELLNLAKNIDEAMGVAGIKKEKRVYTPHLTIGRGKRLVKEETQRLKEEIGKKRFKSVKIKVGEFMLMESKLKPQGPEYLPLARFALS